MAKFPDDDGDDDRERIELPPRLKDWIAKKSRGYHARKTSSKTVAQYKAGLEYTAAERLELVFQHELSEEIAENIVFQALGKSSAFFHALIAQALREREIRICAERDVHKARADAQGPMIEQLRESQEQIRDNNAQMREFMNGMGSMMRTMMQSIENIAKLQITHDPKPEGEGDDD